MITTERLDLVPASPELLCHALADDLDLARALDASLPEDWPPEFYDADSLTYTLDRLASEPESAGWAMYFFLRRADRTLIGHGGYVGPPTPDGTVEVGYSVVSSMQNRGYATEATCGLVDHAFADARVAQIIAHTLPDRGPSIRVVEKLGFERSAKAPEPGVLQYFLKRRGADQPRTAV